MSASTRFWLARRAASVACNSANRPPLLVASASPADSGGEFEDVGDGGARSTNATGARGEDDEERRGEEADVGDSMGRQSQSPTFWGENSAL